jgi:predicted HAD superfamily Cof-like phosphohydrolase
MNEIKNNHISGLKQKAWYKECSGVGQPRFSPISKKVLCPMDWREGKQVGILFEQR